MTARNQPHKYRCETCTYFKLYEPERTEFADCLHPDFKNDPFMREIHGYEYDRIEVMGCASHSDAGKAEQRIADVIKELQKRESEAECGLTLTDYHKIVSMLHELALLREKGE